MITRTRAVIPPSWAGTAVEEDLSGWPVTIRFEPPEKDFPVGLVDLSHCPKAVIQGPVVQELGGNVPGKAIWKSGAYIGFLKPDEAALFDIAGTMTPEWPDPCYTDMTEGWILLGLFGPRTSEVMARLVPLDVERSDTHDPLYLVTESHGMTLQILNLRKSQPGFLMACGRSQGQNLYDSCLRAGRSFGLKPVGMKAFTGWFNSQVTPE